MERILITEERLQEIVQETINRILENNNQTLDYNDFIPSLDNSKFIENAINELTLYDKLSDLSEGLIKTYPIGKVVNIISNEFNLNEANFLITSKVQNNSKSIDLLTIILPKTVNKEFIGKVKSRMEMCGYYLNKKPSIKNGEIIMVFAPKFIENISDKIRERCRYLYHLTYDVYLNKIQRKGLIPSSKNTVFKYPDRIYLMLGNNLNSKQLEIFKILRFFRNKSNNQESNPNEVGNSSILMIDLEKVPNNVQFFVDPMTCNAIYTTDNIPPTAIVGIKSFNI